MWLMRAEPCAALVSTGICHPCQERAFTPMSCSTIASSPAVICSPVATTASYSRRSYLGEASFTQVTSWLVVPAIADTTTATLLPASCSRLTCRATFRMRSRSATDVPPNFITTTAISIAHPAPLDQRKIHVTARQLAHPIRGSPPSASRQPPTQAATTPCRINSDECLKSLAGWHY